jgi:hypothetical protein
MTPGYKCGVWAVKATKSDIARIKAVSDLLAPLAQCPVEVQQSADEARKALAAVLAYLEAKVE